MPPLSQTFDRKDHVFPCPPGFRKILDDAVRFFSGTPVHALPPPVKFAGSGVYAIYCIATDGIYQKYGNVINKFSYHVPIYVGKAVPQGWRQSREVHLATVYSTLYSRLRQHARSINDGSGLKISDFTCRFMILEGETASLTEAIEAALIALYSPLWNSVIDGFGNHNPGKERRSGRITQWDTLHPGRGWAAEMTGERPLRNQILKRVKDYMAGLRQL